MIVQGFVPDWPGTKQHAKETADIIRQKCPVTILDNPNHYFTEQFNEMRKRFTGDVMFWCMADVYPPKNFSEMYDRALELMSKDVRIYAPDVVWMGQKLFRHKMKEVYPNVYDTPCPEMLCWFVHKDVLEIMPYIDPKINKFGWGIEYVAVAAARLLRKIAVRDYNFVATHPRGGNYNNEAAAQQFENMLESLPGGWGSGARNIHYERQDVGVRNVILLIGDKGVLRDSLYYLLGLSGKDIIYACLKDQWEHLISDAQDVYYLYEDLPDELITACKENSVTNLWYKLPTDPKKWGGRDWRYYTHPKYEISITDRMGVPCGWLLPQKLVLK